jgi:hypothetical protein
VQFREICSFVTALTPCNGACIEALKFVIWRSRARWKLRVGVAKPEVTVSKGPEEIRELDDDVLKTVIE